MSKATMKAAICKQYGPPEVLSVQTVPRPIPQSDEVLIRVMASGVNSADVRVRGLAVEGFMKIVMRIVLGFTGPRKPVLGVVFSGIVEETGNKVTEWKPGQRVFGMTGMSFGANAEYMRIKANGTISIMPENATFEEAAALPFGGTTALHFFKKAGLDKAEGKRVLIYGATGSVGTSAIQIARALKARITAVCSEAGENLTRSLGAEKVLFYTGGAFPPSEGEYDLIFDAVGKISKKTVKPLLAKTGQFVTVGGLEVASETKEQLEYLKTLFEKKQLLAVIDRSYALSEIMEAHRYVDSGRKKGNVVLTHDQRLG